MTPNIDAYPQPLQCGCGEQLNRTVREIELDAQAACPSCGRPNNWPRPDRQQIIAKEIQRREQRVRKRP